MNSIMNAIPNLALRSLTLVAVLALAPIATAQESKAPAQAETPPAADASTAAQPGQDPSAAATSNQEEKREQLRAVVSEVKGSAEWALPGVSVLVDDGWTQLKVGDELASGTQIRTGIRGHVNLLFGEGTIVSIRRATHASIDDFYKGATAKRVEIGLGYGTVRGGSSEGELEPDLVVDSPVATLAKRGTEGWEIQVERSSSRFRISLAQSGLVEAISKAGRSRTVAPGQYATDATVANLWVNQETFDRAVSFYEPYYVGEADAQFAANNSRTFASVSPGGGRDLRGLTGQNSAAFVASQTPSAGLGVVPARIVGGGGLGALQSSQGNFGTPSTFKIAARQGFKLLRR